MRPDTYIRIVQLNNTEMTVGAVIWEGHAELEKLKPADSDVDEAISVPATQSRIRFHYSPKHDPVFTEPSGYGIEFRDSRQMPSATILNIQMSMDRRYVEVML